VRYQRYTEDGEATVTRTKIPSAFVSSPFNMETSAAMKREYNTLR
jgi:hypothetical protein